MPKGHHSGRKQTRPYTSEYYRLPAKLFKSVLHSELGQYNISGLNLPTGEHRIFSLKEHESGLRFATFTIGDKPHQIALKLDHRSAGNKLYISCPYCQYQRQHLYAFQNGYACRKCLGLHYASQSERPQERLLRRIRKLRRELWGLEWPLVDNMFEPVSYWPKPKNIHWKTFEHKRDKIIALEKAYWPLVNHQINRMFSLNDIPEYCGI